MLHEFLTANEAELLTVCRDKAALRATGKPGGAFQYGLPVFLQQVIRTLAVEQSSNAGQSHRVSGPPGGVRPVLSEIGAAASAHGRELLQNGFSIDQVVHEYGDMCQAITELACRLGYPIDADEFQTLNRCLDNAIAEAVTEFSYQRDVLVEDQAKHAMNERLGFFAHELRNFLSTASLALAVIKTGSVGVTGATGAVLEQSLIGLRSLIDRSLADVRMTAGLPPRFQLLSVADMISDVSSAALLEAQARGCSFTVSRVDPALAVDADRDLLCSAVGNLLQNAFKFTRPDTDVSLKAYAAADRILIEVEDHCGGLDSKAAEHMSEAFSQGSPDRSGLGRGLSICQRSVEANNGSLSFRNIDGEGCIFTVNLPRRAAESTASSA